MLHENRNPLVSIILPCYNHGIYIDETLNSIDRIKDKNLYEVIIVNDGSTDTHTNERLEAIAKTGLYKVITQKNQGVSVARNTALANARGKFILPVDSDNRLLPEYIDEALNVFDKEPETMIVYCDYNLFEAETGIRVSGGFNLQRLMLGNFIDTCSMYRKEMIDKIGNYHVSPTIAGIADWDLWLRAAFNGCKFHYINKPLFDYRVLKNSMIQGLIANKKKGNINTEDLILRYKDYFGPQYIDENILDKFRSNFFGFLFKIVLKLYFPKKFSKMVENGKLRKYIV